MPWFVKQETFLRPYAAMKPHLAAHRLWVEELRAQGVVISSGGCSNGGRQWEICRWRDRSWPGGCPVHAAPVASCGYSLVR